MDDGILVQDLDDLDDLPDTEYLMIGSTDIRKISIPNFISAVKNKIGYEELTAEDADEICV